MFELAKDDKRIDVLESHGNLLIMGGPGSGKTTIALFKAKALIEKGVLKEGQKILFLSFARATISRVEEHAGDLIPKEIKKLVEINTYHGFIWHVLQSHGYLLTSNPLQLLPPHEAASRLSGVSKENIQKTLRSLFDEQGIVHFDLFANLCNELLTKSNSLCQLVCDMYPIIMLDEFQDTNAEEWGLIRTLGTNSTLIALADPEQRIYDFRGADPKRITNFIETFSPKVFDFGTENNRSNGTDIVKFGNDLLSKTNRTQNYNNVLIYKYPFRADDLKHVYLKIKIMRVSKWLIEQNIKDWSLAVLVPTNALMLEISDMLQKEQNIGNGKKLPKIAHEVSIDSAGPSLAALLIATMLDKGSIRKCTEEDILIALTKHILGRKGNRSPSKKDVEMCAAINNYLYENGNITGKNRKALVAECARIAEEANNVSLSGNIIADWKLMVELLKSSIVPNIQNVAHDAGYLRLLQKGSQLYTALDTIWRSFYSYRGAQEAVSNAFTQEHFSLSTKKWTGINVMTIHKSKGKEFDAVIVYDGRYQNGIVASPDRIDQARLNLRVAVTRAKKVALILTPEESPCPLI